MIFALLLQAVSTLPTDASALESAISALESDIKTLESSSVPLEHRLPCFTGIVALGVAMELWVIWHERCDDTVAWRRGVIRSPDRPSTLKFIVELASVLLITGGIVGELWIGIEITSLNGRLRSKSAELRSKTAQLVALINQEAERLRNDTEVIRASLAWRSLSPHDEKLISNSLASFHEQQFAVWFDAGDPEGAAFAWDIAGVLHRTKLNVYSPAGIGHLPPSGTPFDPKAAALKTGIEVSSTEAVRSRTAAAALVHDFVSAGFNAGIATKPEKGEQAVVWINVKTRPRGAQGTAKLKFEEAAKNREMQSSQTGHW